MANSKKSLGITELVLRDAHQSILATRLRIEDMLPICEKLDQIVGMVDKAKIEESLNKSI